MNSIESLRKQLQDICNGLFPDVGSDEYDPEDVEKHFSVIEGWGQPGVEVVAEMLPNPRVRKLLIAVQGRAQPYLECALARKDENAHHTPLDIAEEIGEPVLGLAELAFREHQSERVRARGAYLIFKHGDIKALEIALTEGNVGLRRAAVGGLNLKMLQLSLNEQMDASYEPAVSLLTRALGDTDSEVRQAALHPLGRVQRLSVEAADRALSDTASGVRYEAVYALAQMGIDQVTAPIWVRALEDVSKEVSDYALRCLGGYFRDAIDAEALVDAIIDVLVIRSTNLPSENFNPDIVAQAMAEAMTMSPRLPGRVLDSLCSLAFDYADDVRTRSVLVTRRLEPADFLTLVQERSAEDPVAAQAILRLMGGYTDTNDMVRKLSEVAPGDVQGVVALQTGLLQQYYENALEQSKTSFRWAVISTTIAFVCLLASVGVMLVTILIAKEVPNLMGILTGVGSLLAQFLAGGQFWLYDRARQRLERTQLQLQKVQRYQLANSVCEALEGQMQQQTRANLVRAIANLETGLSDFPTA
jgi:hypothetical protein